MAKADNCYISEIHCNCGMTLYNFDDHDRAILAIFEAHLLSHLPAQPKSIEQEYIEEYEIDDELQIN